MQQLIKPLKRQPGVRKAVTFSYATFLEHKTICGDNPAVSDGIPVELSWVLVNTFVLSCDEPSRPRRSSKGHYVGRWSKKKRLHLALSSASEKEIAENLAIVSKTKRQRLESNGDGMMGFFSAFRIISKLWSC